MSEFEKLKTNETGAKEELPPCPSGEDIDSWEWFCEHYSDETHPGLIKLVYKLFEVLDKVPIRLLGDEIIDTYNNYVADGVLNMGDVLNTESAMQTARDFIERINQAEKEHQKLSKELEEILSEQQELIQAYVRMFQWNNQSKDCDEWTYLHLVKFISPPNLKPEECEVSIVKSALVEFASINTEEVSMFQLEEEKRHRTEDKEKEKRRAKDLRGKLIQKSDVTVYLAERLGFDLPRMKKNFFNGATVEQLDAVSVDYGRFVELAKKLGSEPAYHMDIDEVQEILGMMD